MSIPATPRRDTTTPLKPRRRARRLAAVVAALACGLVGGPGAAHAAPPPRPNIIFVVIDTLRADRVDGYGGSRQLTPYLRYLGIKGVVFRNAHAASSWTRPSVASLFTSRYPSQHLVNSGDSVLSEEEQTFAEILAAQGYSSVGYSANLNIAPETGFGQGFKAFQSVRAKGAKTRGPELRAAAMVDVDRFCRPPCLLYFQLMEPHTPYRAPALLRQRLGRNLSLEEDLAAQNECSPAAMAAKVQLDAMEYDAEVAAADVQVRELFKQLEAFGLVDNSIIIVTADHGEEFLDHGGLWHGTSLYEELIHVPLMIIAPGMPSFRVVDDNVSLVDLAPTLLDLLALPPEPRFEGQSLVPLMRAGGLDLVGARGAGGRSSRDVVFELLGGWPMRLLQKHESGILRGTQKTLVARDRAGFESYDLRSDAGETRRLPAGSEGPLLQKLDGIRADLATRALAAPETRPLDEETREQLRQLGYDF